MTLFRDNIAAMSGYVPGEQPKSADLIKLNTNENPYPPSPKVAELLRNLDFERLRLYPDPVGSELRKALGAYHGLSEGNVILGNGSDDILTIALRSFAGEGDEVACLEPSYSLYPVLSKIQNTPCREIALNSDFSLASDLAEQAKGAKLFFLTRPNAPTGTLFPKNEIEAFCREFRGVVLIDEAYAGFAEDDCIDLVSRFPNVIVSRTFSKSHSLAGIRFGYALGSLELIEGMMKVKDSYNVNYLTQEISLAALKDDTHLEKNLRTICEDREYLASELASMGFEITPSQANFLFVSPPEENAEEYFEYLRERNIVVRYFPGESTARFVRITVGTHAELTRLLDVTREFFPQL